MSIRKPWLEEGRQARVRVLLQETADVLRPSGSNQSDAYFASIITELEGPLPEFRIRQIYVEAYRLMTMGMGGPRDVPVLQEGGAIDRAATARLDELANSLYRETRSTFRRSRRLGV